MLKHNLPLWISVSRFETLCDYPSVRNSVRFRSKYWLRG